MVTSMSKNRPTLTLNRPRVVTPEQTMPSIVTPEQSAPPPVTHDQQDEPPAPPVVCSCGRVLTENERIHYGSTCESCEGATSRALDEEIEPPPAPPRPRVEGDLVDRIFDLLQGALPPQLSEDLEQAKAAVREEFGGEPGVWKQSSIARRGRAEEVLRLFNGRNAAEVARQLGIGRATVYRLLKQAR